MNKKIWNIRLQRIERHVKEMLIDLGLDLNSPDLKETPKRVAKMYYEIFAGLDEKKAPEITVFPNTEKYSSMVMVKEIPFYSICSHHLVPFFGVGHIAYIPDKSIAGLSKLARVLEFFAKKPQMQERLTEEIANYLELKLKPRGVMVAIEARHLCMEMRGIEKYGSVTLTSTVRGLFKSKNGIENRREFMSKIINSDRSSRNL